MSDAQDHSTLKWIRAELDTLIDQARDALEQYAEGVGESKLMTDCVGHLHQLRGTLQLLQLYGAAMLAEEMELVADGIGQGSIRKPDEAVEALMLALAHMPGYLEKLEGGVHDMPLLVLPYMNELRAARSQALLSEVALFAPDLEQRLVNMELEGAPSTELPTIGRQLRVRYHKGLLEWYQGVDVEDGLRVIASILEELENTAGTSRIRQYFRIARAAAEGAQAGDIKSGVAFKELFGRLDREVKRIIDQGEAPVAEAPDYDLLKNFLYYIASSGSEHPLVQEVKKSYGLDQGIFSQAEIDREKSDLLAPDYDLLSSLGSAIGADLTGIKDGLDLYIRSDRQDVARLAELETPLRKVADTLGMIGQGALRERLKRQAEQITEIVQTGQAPDEQSLMAMAGDILFIETSLENMAGPRQYHLAPPSTDSGLSDLPQGEFEKLVESVMQEAESDIARNKDSIISYIENPVDRGILDAVPRRFISVAGAFKIIHLDLASDLLSGLSRYVERRLLSSDALPPDGELDLFADAMTSIEYFMQAVTEGRGVHNEILEVAQQALASLGEAPATKTPPEETAAPLEAVPAVELPMDEADLEPAAEIALDGLEVTEIEVPPVPEEVAPVADGIDPEILEIFVEESREELAVIQEHLPRWINDPQQQDALATFRRSFHTLKGSGRLVGASDIGEFAWSIENLLNRLIDGTVERSPELVALLQQAQAVLPELVESQAAGQRPGADVNSLMQRAFELAEPGKTQIPAEAVSKPVEQVAVESPQVAEPPPPLSVDPGLLEIFASETRGHLENLQHFVDECHKDPRHCDLNQREIARALHTLHGSADMARVLPIASVSTGLEAYVSMLGEHGRNADQGTLELIGQSIKLMTAVLDVINVPGESMPEWQPLVQEIEHRKRRLQHELEMALTESEPQIAVPAAAAEGVTFQQFEADEELVEIFLEEGRELIESLEESLRQLHANPQDGAIVNDLERTLHTLKGGARLAGVMPMGDLSHAFESLLNAILNQRVEPGPEVQSLAQAVGDRLAEQLDDVSLGPKVRLGSDLIEQMEALAAGREVSLEPEPQAAPVEAEIELGAPEEGAEAELSEPEPETEPDTEAAAAPDELVTEQPPIESAPEPVAPMAPPITATPEVGIAGGARAAQPSSRPRREQIRVHADLLDRLVNNAGEVSIYRARLEQQNGSLAFNLSEMEQTIERLRNQLRKLEIETEAQILFRYERDREDGRAEADFDPLELDRFSTLQQVSRSLLETVNDFSNINDFLSDLQKETDTLLLQQARVATDLQEGLLRTRMVAFSHLVPRLHRVVRQTAGNLEKQAELRVDGAEGELDRSILDRMIGPLEHLLRNAVSHGIESPEARLAAGKSAKGRIDLRLTREGNDLLLTLSDDGGGINIQAIREHAIELELLDPNAELPDSDILQFVLEHGFSTQSEVTQISGRGVGLDVVVKEVKQLGGSLDIKSSPGEGTSFIVRLPLSLAISDALLVEIGEEQYAIPHASIEGVVRLRRAELLDNYEGRVSHYSYADNEYRVRYLGQLMGSSKLNLPEQRRWFPLLLVRAGEHRVALQVDGLLGNRQIVVKSVGPQVSSVRWISGGTILGDGRVALILDVASLVRMDAAHAVPEAAKPVVAERADARRMVMVVDDSITVRKVTGRVLERNGMEVITAKDGVDAVSMLQEQRPDIMLLDIEMPRMDGYELARHMRNTEELRAIPIIMITSRSGEKHRQIALDLGVKRYLGKPYQEAELLENIQQVLAEVGK